jgi:hypothetical protein
MHYYTGVESKMHPPAITAATARRTEEGNHLYAKEGGQDCSTSDKCLSRSQAADTAQKRLTNGERRRFEEAVLLGELSGFDIGIRKSCSQYPDLWDVDRAEGTTKWSIFPHPIHIANIRKPSRDSHSRESENHGRKLNESLKIQWCTKIEGWASKVQISSDGRENAFRSTTILFYKHIKREFLFSKPHSTKSSSMPHPPYFCF